MVRRFLHDLEGQRAQPTGTCTCIVHPYVCFLSTSSAVSVNRSKYKYHII